MAKIVCITSGLTGILHASFELVARLEAAGHQLVCASPENVREKVEVQGFQYVQLPALTLETEPEIPAFSGRLKKVKRWLYKWRHAEKRRELSLESLDITTIQKQLGAFSADLLLIDVELHEYILTAFTAKLPFVLLSQWFSLWKRPQLPYLLHDTIPGKGLKGHPFAIAIAWRLVRWHRQWMFAKKNWMSVGTDRRSALLQAAEKLEFPRELIRDNYWPGPFTYRQLPVISLTAWEMEFPHKKRHQLNYVGPMVFAKRKEIKQDKTEEKRLNELLEQSRSSKGVLIYCSVSSLKSGDRRFLQKVCQAVATEKNWTLILGLGGLLDRSFLGKIPKNVHPFSWVPQLKVLGNADCSINHGGIHTINECIHYQVPMLVYSGKRSDQNGCAARVAYHELGMKGDKDQDTVEDIHQKIRKVLSEKKYGLQMQLMHQYYLAYKTSKRLENLVGEFLN